MQKKRKRLTAGFSPGSKPLTTRIGQAEKSRLEKLRGIAEEIIKKSPAGLTGVVAKEIKETTGLTPEEIIRELNNK